MCLDTTRIVQNLSYITTAGSAVWAAGSAAWALRVYKEKARADKARWVENLYSRFFEKEELKEIRDIVDCAPGDRRVDELVKEEGSKWTDYLNFFELVAYLKKSKQLDGEDVDALFAYYLKCLTRHEPVMVYIRSNSNSFEHLSTLLSEKRYVQI